MGKRDRSEYTRQRRNDPEIRIAQDTKRKEQWDSVKAWVNNYKGQRGCIDCGIKEPVVVLELDHTDLKTCAIADCRSISAAFNEIQDGKCVVRCSNCHRIRTWFDKIGLPYDPNFIYKDQNKATSVKAHIAKIKMVRGCLDCGYNRHAAVLDFHHLEGKGVSISRISRIELVDLELEMNPCIVLCSNCHRIRHWKERTEP